MTDELFYTQLAQLEKYSVVDRRGVRYSDDVLVTAGNSIVFYAEILEADGGWDCTLHAQVPLTKKTATFNRKYDTYYRILTEAKNSIASVIRDIEESSQSAAGSSSTASGSPVQASLNTLAGNWSGESSINKVVLLRGGKGFVIFKNGASMNIDVQINGSAVVISQSSKPNASFYPDLPREVAIVVAQNANPIEWVFSMTDANTLTGIQKTVQFPGNAENDPSKATAAELPAVWKRM
jgi:hypothetical protein